MLWACAGKADFTRLRTLLSAPPRLYSHAAAGAAYAGDLDRYAIVVLDVRAAAAGVLARSRVMDFVRDGGALLYLGAHVDAADGRDVGRFLGPIGVYLDTHAPEAGLFPGAKDGLGKYWARFAIEDGCRLYAEAAYRMVPDGRGEDGAVLAMRDYGRGRIAVLAGAAPLSAGALRSDGNRLFAERLFAWLAEAKIEFRDFDGDGLSDDTEDSTPAADGGSANAVDPGETDFLNADTDGDGIPDGGEDSNLNGRVDDGETDPRNVDSDGDGIFDGADATPAPAAGAPRIINIDPDQGPAEGGYWVTLTGANLSPGSTYWFGEHRARAVQLVAPDTVELRVPDAGNEALETVPVRILPPDGAAEGMLVEGFQYTARSSARLMFFWDILPDWEQRRFRGQLGVRFLPPKDANIRLLRFRLTVHGLNILVWPGIIGVMRRTPGGADMTARQIDERTIEVVFYAQRPGRFLSGDLGTLPWATPSERVSAGITFEIVPGSVRIVATHGGELAAEIGSPFDVRGGARK